MSSIRDSDLAFAGPLKLAAMVRSRELGARELVELYLARIERIDPRLNAFRVTLADEALATASQIDAGGPEAAGRAGPLSGVPIALKDDMPLGGQEMRRGSKSPAAVQPADAEPLRRLRAAGAIPIGITNVPELMLFPWTASDAAGVTRNPWDTTRTPGGSSGGSAAAVAAGLVPAAGGSDGGGSIRIPAACCGLVGMKPTRGRVSAQPLGDGWLGLATYGALTRTVADSALMLDAMHGSAPGDRYAAAPPRRTFLQAAQAPPNRPLRIAISTKLPAGTLARLSTDQRRAFDQTARLLGELGHEVVARHPDYGLVSLEFIQTYLRGAHEEFQTLTAPEDAERSTRQLAALGGRIVSPRRRDRLLAKRVRTIARITRLWEDHDVLLTPGLASTAIAAEGGYGKSAPVALDKAGRFMPWYPVFNLTGQPAISLPAGFDADGLPLSVQLAGRMGDEETLFSLAGQIEAARPWAADRPAIAKL
ncbi:MAG TPA: amidase family protein [Solirubrobacteraceae bacterium]|nr:amidase family protein [Solirubrobacteraceae bacterium]